MDIQVNTLDKLLQEMPPITLADMKSIRLMKRTDKKYVTSVPILCKLLALAKDKYFVQEIDGRRISSYTTTYWDDPENHAFRMHQAGHRPRRKIRVRSYVESNLAFLEIKTKDNHDRTNKKRVEVPSEQAVIEDHIGEDFLKERLGITFNDVAPTVSNRFKRITLVNRAKTERLTIDFDIHFKNLKTGQQSAMPDIVVIELKRDGLVHSPILELLRILRIKPQGFSKYCIGAVVTNPCLRVNRFKKRLIKIRKVTHSASPTI